MEGDENPSGGACSDPSGIRTCLSSWPGFPPPKSESVVKPSETKEEKPSAHAPASIRVEGAPWPIPAAQWEDIAQAFVSICTQNWTEGSGILVGMSLPSDTIRRHVYVLTAAHVARESIRVEGTNTVNVLLRKKGSRDVVRKVFSIPGETWLEPQSQADLALFDITMVLPEIEREGLDYRYVNLSSEVPDDEHAIKHVGFCRRRDFAKAGLGLGSDIFWLATSGEVWCSTKRKGRMPMVMRRGSIAMPEGQFVSPVKDRAEIIAVDCHVIGCASGGPVFSTVPLGNRMSPVLIGIGKAQLAGLPDTRYETSKVRTADGQLDPRKESYLGLITPLDDILAPRK